jgi:hypothetical protein
LTNGFFLQKETAPKQAGAKLINRMISANVQKASDLYLFISMLNIYLQGMNAGKTVLDVDPLNGNFTDKHRPAILFATSGNNGD